jgi:hypothetical protein
MVIYATCACKLVAEVFFPACTDDRGYHRLLTDSEELKSDYLFRKIGDGFYSEELKSDYLFGNEKVACIGSYTIGHKAAQSKD